MTQIDDFVKRRIYREEDLNIPFRETLTSEHIKFCENIYMYCFENIIELGEMLERKG